MLLNKTECKCGKKLDDVKFDRYIPNFDKSFYGGRVDMYGYYKCQCGRELKGFFTRLIDQRLRLIDLEVLNDITEEKKIDLEPTSCVYQEPKADYIPETYDEMNYRELKKVAKEKGITGNLKREEIINQLKELAQ